MIITATAAMVANAAGPVMTIYLLAMRLPKLEFLGTGAVFFFLINWIKVPFMVDLGLINAASLTLNLQLAPAVLVGAWLGRIVAARINQNAFENLSLALAAAADCGVVLGRPGILYLAVVMGSERASHVRDATSCRTPVRLQPPGPAASSPPAAARRQERPPPPR